MKILGICVIVAGIIWAIVGFNMQTTVTTGPQNFGSGTYSIETPSVTVNNIGLMDRRRNNLMFAGLTILVGVVLTGCGVVSENSPSNESGRVKCPYCAEVVKAEAIVCKHCGRDLPEDSQAQDVVQAEAESVYTTADYVRDNKPKLLELCKKLDSKSLSFYEYQLLAPAAGATVGLVSRTFSIKYSITHHDETIVFNRVKELRSWFQSNVVPLVVGEA